MTHNNIPDIRVGNGFDVHAFDSEPASVIRLGGIDIPHSQRLKGHSDADVVLHSVTDAILGACGLGDIGEHFPPSNDEFKDMDSANFLQFAIKMVKGKINNIDVTIICEAPKLGAHKLEMATQIASICGIDASRVNVKATTTEALGFTGRGEGVACFSSVSVILI